MLTPEERAAWRTRTAGQPGPQTTREESVSFQSFGDGVERVCVHTTRPATVADLIDSERPILSITSHGDTLRVLLPGTEYRMGGVIGALKRAARELTEEQREVLRERGRALASLSPSLRDEE